MPGMIPSDDSLRRFAKATKHYEQTYLNPGLREEKVVRRRGGGCKARNEIWQITIFGTPTGGTFDMAVNVLGTTDTLTFDYDFTAAEVETEFETHTNIASGDVEVTGGPFPDAAVIVEFKGDLASHSFPLPITDFASLTGGSGVGMVPICYHGHPTDGSVSA